MRALKASCCSATGEAAQPPKMGKTEVSVRAARAEAPDRSITDKHKARSKPPPIESIASANMTTPPALRPYRIAGRHFVPLIVLSLFGQLTFASATAHSFCFAHNSPKQSQRADENVDAITSSNIHVGRRKAVETAGAAFISSQVPIAVIAADEQGVVKDNGDPLAAFGASLSGSDASAIMSGATSSQQLAGAGATTLPSSAAAGGPPRTAAAGTPPSSLDATLDQLSKKRTIEPRTHG